jgi:hypothetical protein
MEEKTKKSIIEELKSELEEMEGKLKKSGDEFKVLYREKKKKVADLIKKYAHEVEESGEEKIHDFKESTTELLDLLESDYDLSYTDYETESHKISRAIDKFENQFKAFIERVAEKGKSTKAELEEDLNKTLEKFKTELDIQKAHWKGTKDRATSEYEEWKKGRLLDIEKLKKEIELKKDEAGVKFESFSEELSESVDHLKKAFKKLW